MWNAREGRSAHAPTERKERNSWKWFPENGKSTYNDPRNSLRVGFFIWPISPKIFPFYLFIFFVSPTIPANCVAAGISFNREITCHIFSSFCEPFSQIIFGVTLFLFCWERSYRCRKTTVIATRLTFFTVSWFSMRLEWNIRVWWAAPPNRFLFSA